MTLIVTCFNCLNYGRSTALWPRDAGDLSRCTPRVYTSYSCRLHLFHPLATPPWQESLVILPGCSPVPPLYWLMAPLQSRSKVSCPPCLKHSQCAPFDPIVTAKTGSALSHYTTPTPTSQTSFLLPLSAPAPALLASGLLLAYPRPLYLRQSQSHCCRQRPHHPRLLLLMQRRLPHHHAAHSHIVAGNVHTVLPVTTPTATTTTAFAIHVILSTTTTTPTSSSSTSLRNKPINRQSNIGLKSKGGIISVCTYQHVTSMDDCYKRATTGVRQKTRERQEVNYPKESDLENFTLPPASTAGVSCLCLPALPVSSQEHCILISTVYRSMDTPPQKQWNGPKGTISYITNVHKKVDVSWTNLLRLLVQPHC